MATGLNGLDTIRPPTSVEAARPVAVIGEARQELYQRALQRLVGQSLDSPVLSKYTDGSFLVKFADTPARVILPPGTEVGDSVPLTLVSVDPRPTFFLGNETNGKLAKSPLIYLDPHASDEVELSGETEPPPETPAPPPRPEQTASRNLARQFLQVESLLSPFERMASERASPQNQAPDPNAPARSAQTSLSSAGQLINSLLQAGQSAPRAIVGQNAIVPAPDTGSQEVAAALHDTLAYSGLFYESHVSEWVDGKRPITELLREPQMQQVPTKAENAQDSNQLALP
ncbi:MAG: hypothetical protein RL748_309, partial [Pseudomonadota bacterium]